jgi:hypothetical protein
LLTLGRWFSPGTLASSTTKTGRHDIAEILLKVALNTINQIKSNQPHRQFYKPNSVPCGFKVSLPILGNLNMGKIKGTGDFTFKFYFFRESGINQ